MKRAPFVPVLLAALVLCGDAFGQTQQDKDAAIAAANAEISAAMTALAKGQWDLALANSIVVAAPAVYDVPLIAVSYIPNESSVKVGIDLSKIDPAVYAKMRDAFVIVNGDAHSAKAAGGRRVQSRVRWVGDFAALHIPGVKGAASAEQKAYATLIIEPNGLKDGDVLRVALVDGLETYQPVFRHPHTAADMEAVCPVLPGEIACCFENGHGSDPSAAEPNVIGLSQPFRVHLIQHSPIEGEFFHNEFDAAETVAIVPGPINGLLNAVVPGGPTLAHLSCASFDAQPYGPANDAALLRDLAFFTHSHVHFQALDRNGGYNTTSVRFKDPQTGQPVSFTFNGSADVLHVHYEAESHATERKYNDLVFLRAGDEILSMARKSWSASKFIPTRLHGPCVVAGATTTNHEVLVYQSGVALDATGLVQPPPQTWTQTHWFDPSSYPYPMGIRGWIDPNSVAWLDDSLATRQGSWLVAGTQKGMNLDCLNDFDTGANLRHVFDYYLGLDHLTAFEDGVKCIDLPLTGTVFQAGDTVEIRAMAQCYHMSAECGNTLHPNWVWPGYTHDPFNLLLPAIPPNSNGDLWTMHFDNLAMGRVSSVPATVPTWGAPVPAGG